MDQASIAELKSKIDAVITKVDVISRRMDKMESIGEPIRVESDSFGARLVESVSAIAGLKEALLSRSRTLRVFWAALLCGAILATIFYIFETCCQYLERRSATNVRFEKTSSYQYPPLMLCPDGWIDQQKVNLTQLSVDAVKYGLGYFDDYHNFVPIRDIAATRREFLRYYSDANHESPIDFYKSISIDFETFNNTDRFAEYSGPALFCNTCDRAEKVFVQKAGICIRLFLTDAYDGGTSNKIYAKIKLETNQTFPYFQKSALWYVYYSRNENFEPLTQAFIDVPDGRVTMLKVSAKNYIGLRENSGATRCMEDDRNGTYSPIKCISRCQYEMYKDQYECRLWYLNNMNHDSSTNNLDQFCNFNTPFKGQDNKTLWDFLQHMELERVKTKASSNCSARCPHKCERMFYDLSIVSKADLVDGDPDEVMKFPMMQPAEVSVVSLRFMHSALDEGGVLTYKEVNTYSFIELINNVGGTLGLFVGGTIMTIIQLIVFLVRELMLRGNRRMMVDVGKGEGHRMSSTSISALV